MKFWNLLVLRFFSLINIYSSNMFFITLFLLSSPKHFWQTLLPSIASPKYFSSLDPWHLRQALRHMVHLSSPVTQSFLMCVWHVGFPQAKQILEQFLHNSLPQTWQDLFKHLLQYTFPHSLQWSKQLLQVMCPASSIWISFKL